MTRTTLIASLLIWLIGCEQRPMPGHAQSPAPPAAATTQPAGAQENPYMDISLEKVEKTEAEWRAQLTAEQFRIARQAGTERAFTGAYWETKQDPQPGVYHCVCCDLPLFDVTSKFDSGSGWPSYDRPVDKRFVAEKRDASHGMVRTEIRCARCDAHLGHVFNDGPAETTGMRYCVNSGSLNFKPADGE